MPLKIVVSGRTLTLTGDLDRDVYEHLQSSLTAVADGHVVIDMTNVGTVDEEGLRVLVVEARRRAEAGGTLTVINPSSDLRRQLDTRGLLDFLHVGQEPPPDPANRQDEDSDRTPLTSSPRSARRRWWRRRRS